MQPLTTSPSAVGNTGSTDSTPTGSRGSEATSQQSPGADSSSELLLSSGMAPRQVLVETGRSALDVVRGLIKQLNQVDSGAFTAIARDTALKAALDKASVALWDKGNELRSYQLANVSFELAKVIEALTKYEERFPSLRTICKLLMQVTTALASPEKAELTDLLALLASGRQQALVDHKRIEAFMDASVSGAPLFKQIVGTPEARQEHAEQLGALRGQLEGAFRQSKADDGALRETYFHTSAALHDLKAAANKPEYQPYIDALKEVLSRSLALREGGFVDGTLDQIIQESVVALVAAHTGQGAVVKPAKREAIDRFWGFTARRSATALRGALSDDLAMQEAIKLLVKGFDVKIISREDVCNMAVAELKVAAMRELTEIESLDRWRDRNDCSVVQKRVDAFVSQLKENAWIQEAERYGGTFVDEFSQILSALATDPVRYRRSVVEAMENSYSFDAQTGRSTFTVPAWVSDVAAIEMLWYASFSWPNCIDEDDLRWLKLLPHNFPELNLERDYSRVRRISFQAVVPGTTNQTFAQQAKLLKKLSCVLSDPRDQVMAGVLHSRKHEGADLFNRLLVRSIVPTCLVRGEAEPGGPLRGLRIYYGDWRVSAEYSSEAHKCVAVSGSPVERQP